MNLMLPKSWNTTHHIACSFLLVFLTRLFVVILQKAMTEKKKKMPCCSVPGKASFALDLCVHPCTWSFLHADCSFSCVFPSVWHFLCKALAAALARGVVAVAAPGQCLCHPTDSACCAESPGAQTPWTLPWILPYSHLYSQKLPFTQFFLKLLLGWIIFESLVPDKLCLQGTIASKVKGNKQVNRVWLHRAFFLEEQLKIK